MNKRISCVSVTIRENISNISIEINSQGCINRKHVHTLSISKNIETDDGLIERIDNLINTLNTDGVYDDNLTIKIKEFLEIYLLFKNKRNLLKTLPEGITWFIGGKLEHIDLHNLSVKIDIDLLLTTRVFKFIHVVMKDPTSLFPDFFPIDIGEFRQKIREDLMASTGSIIDHKLIDAKIDDVLSKIEWRKND